MHLEPPPPPTVPPKQHENLCLFARDPHPCKYRVSASASFSKAPFPHVPHFPPCYNCLKGIPVALNTVPLSKLKYSTRANDYSFAQLRKPPKQERAELGAASRPKKTGYILFRPLNPVLLSKRKIMRRIFWLQWFPGFQESVPLILSRQETQIVFFELEHSLCLRS